MYRALYGYKSSLSDYLSFDASDRFTLLDAENQKSDQQKEWLLAQNGIGELGYVPYNYIEKLDCTPTEVVKFIDGSIEAIHLQAGSEGGGVVSQIDRYNLQKLLQHRASYLESVKHDKSIVEKRVNKRPAPEPPGNEDGRQVVSRRTSSGKKAPPPPPTRDSSLGLNDSSVGTQSSPSTASSCGSPGETITAVNQTANGVVTIQKDTPTTPTGTKFRPNSFEIETSPVLTLPPPSGSPNISDHPSPLIPPDIGPELIEEIRINTGLSFDKSKIALETVLGYIGFKIPELSSSMDEIFKTTHNLKQSSEIGTSRDAKRLEVIFSELAACKDDSQQRSWALHEDEAIIKEYIEELNSILENAKKSICRKVVAEENYECIHNLVQYYQMETRLSIRLLLLKSFGALCGLDKMAITMLLCSVLPLELAHDITNKSDEVQRLSYASLVLSMIFSTGEPIPTNLHEHLNGDFISFILSLIENPPTDEHEDQATDLLVSLILAYNLHMETAGKNLVMDVFAEKGTVKIFTEKVMLLFNRGDDPVNIFDHKPDAPNSVIKFFQDLYSAKKTANLLYTNDAMVLIDILIRQISDLPAGDATRSAFLILTNYLIRNSDYEDHRHRSVELGALFRSIATEESDCVSDKKIVVELLKTYEHLF
ncbi:NCK-interacting protein with SH3 domain [Patella vulgata]|uniref:NCK-interacting protein with SH3 domain n=1 Tax=Patella vulgata TaxID=6465 RepID=UPI00217F9A5F|nr:NCK-interacting protein with SH3 domain [Patella vulgata]